MKTCNLGVHAGHNQQILARTMYILRTPWSAGLPKLHMGLLPVLGPCLKIHLVGSRHPCVQLSIMCVLGKLAVLIALSEAFPHAVPKPVDNNQAQPMQVASNCVSTSYLRLNIHSVAFIGGSINTEEEGFICLLFPDALDCLPQSGNP